MTVGVEEVVKELRSTYSSGKTKTLEWRTSQLKAIIRIVTHHEDEIVGALRSDLKKPELESFVHEIFAVLSACKLALKELHRWTKPQKVKTSMTTFPASGEIVPEPLGVVLVISTWNYPFLLSLEPVIGAIAAGNAVVLKPSEVAPATSSVVSKLLEQYMDTTAVKVIEGAVPETNALLEQKWDKIFYTGSSKVGRIILAAAAKHLTPVVLELGGKCPVVVDANINLKVAARRIISGKWGCNNGQTCVSPDYVIITKEYASKLVDALSAELEKFYGKDPMQSKDFSSIVNAHHFDRVAKLLDDEKVSGKIVFGGQRDKTNLKIAPTIILDVPDDSLIMNEEIFGPLLPIVTVNKIEESFGMINAKAKPLAAYLFTNDKKLKEKFIGSVSAGGITINDVALHFAEAGLPFGGVGESGMGAYHGKFSFDAFSHKKAVLRRGFGGDVAARYPPYAPWKLQFLKALLRGNIIGVIRALLGCCVRESADEETSKKPTHIPILVYIRRIFGSTPLLIYNTLEAVLLVLRCSFLSHISEPRRKILQRRTQSESHFSFGIPTSKSLIHLMYIKAFILYLLSWIASAAYHQPQTNNKKQSSSVIFSLSGNVYPEGYYYATINIGQPPKPYFLDIDTGSDLTWLQCDAPCKKCTPAPHSLYKPNRNLITCPDPICASLHGPGNHNCPTPEEQCDYEVEYADHGSSLGVMVKDSFPLKFSNGTIVAPLLAFGCGYDQEVIDASHVPYTDGVLGLGIGKSSILAQLRDMGLTRNVVGHCLSGQGGGYLLFGDGFLPTSGIVWTPIMSQSKYYVLGSADLRIGSQATNIKGLQIVFDSGSTYSYFSSQAYNDLISLMRNNLNGKQLQDAVEDRSLPVCWKGAEPFKSIHDAGSYFKPLVLSFRNVEFQVQPEAYLIVTVHGNVCLGILNGGEVGLGNLNVIGDISMQDKMVIYDNERQQIGWAPANCNSLPKS
ncbi:Aldehyde dehydrogenase [Sesamum alatum]|uniref:Aspartic proteinase Asp1 n=1 Tax=Sesamum alatum TaxID=300844 RepID=A0AAE1YNJ1_9LAMI|nr:Aldehyde dehydrogenase [Sesamum alatum]